MLMLGFFDPMTITSYSPSLLSLIISVTHVAKADQAVDISPGEIKQPFSFVHFLPGFRGHKRFKLFEIGVESAQQRAAAVGENVHQRNRRTFRLCKVAAWRTALSLNSISNTSTGIKIFLYISLTPYSCERGIPCFKNDSRNINKP